MQENKKKLVVLTGAGMSAESGISTFRDSDGLWEKHRIEDVATPEAWQHNPELVHEFYNQRRKQLLTVVPNSGHLALADLEKDYEVKIITQNVDNLHERAGSTWKARRNDGWDGLDASRSGSACAIRASGYRGILPEASEVFLALMFCL